MFQGWLFTLFYLFSFLFRMESRQPALRGPRVGGGKEHWPPTCICRGGGRGVSSLLQRTSIFLHRTLNVLSLQNVVVEAACGWHSCCLVTCSVSQYSRGSLSHIRVPRAGLGEPITAPWSHSTSLDPYHGVSCTLFCLISMS